MIFNVFGIILLFMILQKKMYYMNVMIAQVRLASACSEFVCLCVRDVCLGTDECEYQHTRVEVRGLLSPSISSETRSPFCLPLIFTGLWASSNSPASVHISQKQGRDYSSTTTHLPLRGFRRVKVMFGQQLLQAPTLLPSHVQMFFNDMICLWVFRSVSSRARVSVLHLTGNILWWSANASGF